MRRIQSVFFGSLAAATMCATGLTYAQKPAASAVEKTVDQRVAPGELQRAAAPHIKDLAIDENQVKAHVMRPQHVIGDLSDRGRDEGTLHLVGHRQIPHGPKPPELDVDAFGKELHATLKDQVTGYAMRLRQNGKTIYTLEWNWARTPPDGSVGWTPDRQMHVASVSKLITAMAMNRLLHEKGLPADTKIIDYLPSYWTKGPNIDKISFANLMTHTSGFNNGTDYESMKAAVAAGVSTNSNMADYIGHYRYENMNFGLCRILMSVMNGTVAKNMGVGFPPSLQFLLDPLWDVATIGGYNQFVQNKVFAPADVTTATLDHPGNGVLAYKFPAGEGWNSGNLETVSGGAGWHISIDQLLDVMGTFRRSGKIMSAKNAQDMLDDGFGIDVIENTPAGKLYNKNGLWHDGPGDSRTEQSLAYFLPEEMELVVLANSPVGTQAKFFRDVVTQVYLDNIK